MKLSILCIMIALCLGSVATNAQQTKWQQNMEGARRAAASGEATVLMLGLRHELGSEWQAGAYVFYWPVEPYLSVPATPPSSSWSVISASP